MKKVDCIAIIKRYELARQAVAKLNKKRSDLIFNCVNFDSQSPEATICLVLAYKECEDLWNMNNERYPYDEVLSEGVGEGRYCQNCEDSFNIKHNELAAAKDEFGKAKRAISFFAKKLLKGE